MISRLNISVFYYVNILLLLRFQFFFLLIAKPAYFPFSMTFLFCALILTLTFADVKVITSR